MRAGFWRRLAATWVDWFAIYAVSAFLIEFIAVVGIRIAIEPLCVVVGAVYGTVMLTLWAQTIGKMLLGIAVTTKTGAEPRLRNVLLREALGKWGTAFAAPAALGRLLVGQAWIPTVYDLLILLPVLLVLFLHYLIVKRTWYDWLGGTAVERVREFRGRAKPAFAVLMAAAVLGLGTKTTQLAMQGFLPCRLSLYRSMHSTAPYVAFLKQEHAKPVDYVIDLFDRYDVVVLCERLHPEASQWDFIYELIRDPRFGDRVGHVFTEYGQVGMQAYLDDFMATDGLDATEVHDRAVHIMRNVPVWPTWTNTNFYTYLTRLYELNQSLPPDQRIHHHFTDSAVDWAKLTTEKQYRAYLHSLADRDRQMAQTVITEMGRLAKSQDKPPKCLVVMNYRHAFDLTGGTPSPPASAANLPPGDSLPEVLCNWDQSRRRNTYEYIRDAFGQRAANVLLGEYRLFVPIAGGVWDAAFAETGWPPAGFDFAGSPFGEDPFDLFPFVPVLKGRLKYRDVFTGLVYAQSLDQQYTEAGIPGYYRGFEEEAVRRGKLLGGEAVHWYEYEMEQERTGVSCVKSELAPRMHLVESVLDLCPLALNSMGLLIGVVSFGLGQWRYRSRRDASLSL